MVYDPSALACSPSDPSSTESTESECAGAVAASSDSDDQQAQPRSPSTSTELAHTIANPGGETIQDELPPERDDCKREPTCLVTIKVVGPGDDEDDIWSVGSAETRVLSSMKSSDCGTDSVDWLKVPSTAEKAGRAEYHVPIPKVE
ncbi:hypothetical protein H0H87_003234 [Tephrocybe sp. NHM501043]|nr:hypothetical protein H0H87_003234 [Tephrocybe sp. NHM501043]